MRSTEEFLPGGQTIPVIMGSELERFDPLSRWETRLGRERMAGPAHITMNGGEIVTEEKLMGKTKNVKSSNCPQ